MFDIVRVNQNDPVCHLRELGKTQNRPDHIPLAVNNDDTPLPCRKLFDIPQNQALQKLGFAVTRSPDHVHVFKPSRKRHLKRNARLKILRQGRAGEIVGYKREASLSFAFVGVTG